MGINEKLKELKDKNIFKLPPVSDSPCEAVITLNGKKTINLSSNNYLGFANHKRLAKAAQKGLKKYGVGSGAVRTIVGNMRIHEELEQKIALFKKEEAALVFQSGYMCNLGVIQAITDKGDLILSDELNHASIIDGVRLSKADKQIYKHNNMKDLEKILKEKRSQYKEVLIVTDGVFSMDGDLADLVSIVKLAKKYNCLTYVDDAHGSGVLGENGRGTVDHFKLNGQIDFVMGTLSKAIGVVGGYVACSTEAKEYLLNRGRPQLFSTSLMPSAASAIIEAFSMLEQSVKYTEKLWANANYFKKLLQEKGFNLGSSQTPITPIMIGNEAKTILFSKQLLERGVFVSAIVFPTVPVNTGRIRLMPTALHSKRQLKKAVKIIFQTAKELNLISVDKQ